VHDLTIFEDLGNGQTKLTFIGNEPMESATNSGQMEGWNQMLDKVAAVIAGLVQAKWEVDVLMIVMREIQLRLALVADEWLELSRRAATTGTESSHGPMGLLPDGQPSTK
jgi:hypothetical protein